MGRIVNKNERRVDIMEEKLKQLHLLARATLYEIKKMGALLKYQSEDMIVNNYSRLVGDIDSAMEDLNEIKKMIQEIELSHEI